MTDAEFDTVHQLLYGRREELDPSSNEYVFQLIDVQCLDYMPPQLDADVPAHGQDFSEALLDMKNDYGGECSVYLFGRTMCKHSVVARVHGFRPYLFYYRAGGVEALLRHVADKTNLDTDALRPFVRLVKRKHLYGFEPNSMDRPTGRKEHEYYEVSFPTLRSFRLAKSETACHEGIVDPIFKFLDKVNLVPSQWVAITGGNVAALNDPRFSHGDVEITCGMRAIQSRDMAMIAPLLVAAMDIESYSATRCFPDADVPADRVACIGMTLWWMGAPVEDKLRICLVLGTCDAVEGKIIISFDTEAALLAGYRRMITTVCDVDIEVTYNGFFFDYPYLCKRAALLGVQDFLYMHRLVCVPCTPRSKTLASSALGDNELFVIGMYGRTNLDLFQWVKASEKLRSYKLDSVASHFLGQNKIPMDYQDMFELCDGSSADRARVADYCEQDAALLIDLCSHLQCLVANVEMSRVCLTLMESLVTRGQQIKVLNQLAWHAHRLEQRADGHGGYLLNTPAEFSGGVGDKYEGATVLEPDRGFYDKDPVAVLDFASLYPSIIIAFNLCFSTLVLDPRFENIPGVNYDVLTVSDTKRYVFVNDSAYPGVLKRLLSRVLGARKEAKVAMANASTKLEAAIFNSRQKALKVSANSVYGFTGAMATGMYRCLGVADGTTYHARRMLLETVQLVQQFTPCKVVYGDTDSVMVVFDGSLSNEAAFDLGDKAAAFITDKFPAGVELEMEKTFYPYMLINKKRYAGLSYVRNKQGEVVFNEVDAKGIELARRDNCLLAKAVYERGLNALLYERNVKLCCERVAEDLQRMASNDFGLDQYIVSKQLKKDYVNEDAIAHKRVVDKMRERRPGSEPQVGDRVPYVIIQNARAKAKVADRAEDPEYVRQHPKLKIDRCHYAQTQIINPIAALLEPVKDAPLHLLRAPLSVMERQRDRQTTLGAFLQPADRDAPPSSTCAFEPVPHVGAIKPPSGTPRKNVAKKQKKTLHDFLAQ